jgi:hypothetical protein
MLSHIKVSRLSIAVCSTALTLLVITYLILDGTGTSVGTSSPVRRETIQQIWEYKLNLTTRLGNLSAKEIALFGRLRSIQESCGEVCNTSIKGVPGKVKN